MKDLKLIRISDDSNPEDIFPLVMRYAATTSKNPWVCLYEVMSNGTIVIYSDDNPIAYLCGYRNDDGNLFITHAYCEQPVGKDIFDELCRMLVKDRGTNPTVIISSDLPERLLKKYEFEVSEILYHKHLALGGD